MRTSLYAFIGLAISIIMCFSIVREVLATRIKVFKEQNMEECTKFTWTRVVIMCKTIAYYTTLCLFPKRLGLYHVYGYHYNDPIKKQDKIFWAGIGLLAAMILGIIYGNFLIKFGIIWYLTYIAFFSNWITMHQFIGERYCYIPVIGLCLLLAGVLEHSLLAFGMVCGLYMMRTWVHLPTYEDEVPFYQSNIWNFPDSEVAFANLGVTYIKRGLMGSAIDMWLISLKINKDYDVAYYNLSSTLKTKGDLKSAHANLKKAIECPSCHFREIWKRELTQLEGEMRYVDSVNKLSADLYKLRPNPKAQELEKSLAQLQQLHKQVEEERKVRATFFQQQESRLTSQLISLQTQKQETEKPQNMDELVKLRDKKFAELQGEFNKLGESHERDKV